MAVVDGPLKAADVLFRLGEFENAGGAVLDGLHKPVVSVGVHAPQPLAIEGEGGPLANPDPSLPLFYWRSVNYSLRLSFRPALAFNRHGEYFTKNATRLQHCEPASRARPLALMVGVSRQYLIDIENGRANPTVDVLERIAAGLDVQVALLFRMP